MSSLTPFLKDKYEFLFDKVYDTNKNGVITHSDFMDKLEQLNFNRNWSPDEKRYKESQKTLENAWNALKQNADINKDNQISKDEWFQYWGQFVAKSHHGKQWPTEMPWVKNFANFWFDMTDISDDGTIDENEFGSTWQNYKIDETEAQSAYQKLGGKPVNRETFAKLWLTFMTSDNKNEPGNFIFGKVTW